MIKASIGWLSGAVLLAACQRDAAPVSAPVLHAGPKAAAVAPLKPGPTPQELTVGMVEAVTVGKAALPLTIKFDLPQRPSVGQPLGIVVVVIPQSAGGSVTVQPVGDDGLSVAANAGPIEIPSPDPSQGYRLTIPVTPTVEGLHILGLRVSMKQDDVIETGSFSIPVIVAAAAAAGQAVPAPTAAIPGPPAH